MRPRICDPYHHTLLAHRSVERAVESVQVSMGDKVRMQGKACAASSQMLSAISIVRRPPDIVIVLVLISEVDFKRTRLYLE